MRENLCRALSITDDDDDIATDDDDGRGHFTFHFEILKKIIFAVECPRFFKLIICFA